ncbi:3,4-dihydroxy-2-butanone 4-phosphate synthase [Elysia marginata]|uniref:3,4-dihydroxy-2-butanone-4-phosphate synthase n=1 Tax=Elysia marginata TaxID=1093978 RepID=A0AAV4FV83_9GAST|nr:3,4-dihydroxy-2-butanone 4-phosphate synthase [Elysia marginata]
MNGKDKKIFNNIDEAILDIKNGRIVIVVDDEDRENEGDFVGAAELVTDKMINFMATFGRGLICTPLTEKRCKGLNLPLMVSNTLDPMQTAFTVSVDLKGDGVSTGISAKDRAKTVKAIADRSYEEKDFLRPGHVFPLIAKTGGVLRRAGHTEAAIDLARLAGLEPAGVIVEIMNEDGTMARLPQLLEISKKLDVKIISIEQLISYRIANESLIEKIHKFEIKTRFGNFILHSYKQTTNGQVHIALTKGQWKKEEPVAVRVHSGMTEYGVLEALLKEPDHFPDSIFEYLKNEGNASVIFINRPVTTELLLNRLNALSKQKEKIKKQMPKQNVDFRDFGIGAQILNDLKISKIKLLTKSDKNKRIGLSAYNLEIVEYIDF